MAFSSPNHAVRPDDDSIDLREILLVLRRGALWIVLGALMGLSGGAAVSWLLPPRYEATTKVLLRNDTESPGSALSLLTGGAGGLGGLIGGAAQGGVDTELEILTSRSSIGAVVDSLGLQVRVIRPRATHIGELVSGSVIDPNFDEAELKFVSGPDGYAVTGPGVAGQAQPGEPFNFPGGQITLRHNDLPPVFELEILDRESTITEIEEALEPASPVGEVVEISYRAGDPHTAADVPNALFRSYYERRTTTDRGVNRKRFDFLLQKEDSISAELAQSEVALRQHQQISGVFDPQATGSAELEHGVRLRGDLETLNVEINSLRQVLDQIGRGGDIRDVAAFPTFLQSVAINDILTRLFEAEAELVELRQGQRPLGDNEPEVVVMMQTVSYLEGQLATLSREYLAALEAQGREMSGELARYRGLLATLPASAEQSLRLQREVLRLSETQNLLQAQLIDARLASITEGGDVRQVDVAVPPREPSFPSLPLNLAIGVFAGLFFGTLVALGRGYFGQSVKDPWEAELASGVPALSLNGRVPLLLPQSSDRESILLIPLGRESSSGAAARKLAGTAAAQGRSVAMVEIDSTSVEGGIL